MIGIGRQTKIRRQVGINATARQNRTGVVEIALPLLLGRPQGIEDTVPAIDADCTPAACKRDGLTNPVTRISTGKNRVFKNGIKPGFRIIIGIAVSTGEQAGCPKA
jgi:hypothetical protein